MIGPVAQRDRRENVDADESDLLARVERLERERDERAREIVRLHTLVETTLTTSRILVNQARAVLAEARRDPA